MQHFPQGALTPYSFSFFKCSKGVDLGFGNFPVADDVAFHPSAAQTANHIVNVFPFPLQEPDWLYNHKVSIN
jgi:hypothetical protein